MSVQFTKAPTNWEIIQQTDRQALLQLAGTYTVPEGADLEHYKIYVGVLDEISESPIIPWQSPPANDGKWNLQITLPVGGLYRLEVRDTAKPYAPPINADPGQAVHHIGVGDNFLIAGQSNAAGVGKGEVEDAPDMMVHVLRDRKYWDMASHPLDFPRGRHTPWLAFAKTMSRKLGYPVGIIPTAVSGSLIKSWLPEEQGELYADMMNVISTHKVGVKAVVWYQGCSEALMCEGATYEKRLTSFISHIREDLGNPDLPIFMLQLNRRMDGEATPAVHEGWSQVREAQRQVSHKLKNVSLTSTFDARLSDGIHNGSMTNPAIGQRLAQQVLYTFYGIGTNHNPPEIADAERLSDTKIRLTFANATTLQTFAVGKRIPILVEDKDGKVEIEKIVTYGAYMEITLERPLSGDAFVSGAHGEEQAYFVCDGLTQIPMLGFYRFPVR